MMSHVINVQAKPFLKWAGGKTQLLKEIANTMPAEIAKWDSFTYIEPFVCNRAVIPIYKR